MITTLDIQNYIADKIHANFKEKVVERDSKEAYPESCFFIYIDKQEMHSMNISQNKKIYPILIHFKNPSNVVVQETSEKLMRIFDFSHKIKDTWVVVSNFECEIYEEDLILAFDISFYVGKNRVREEREIMKKLRLKIEE